MSAVHFARFGGQVGEGESYSDMLMYCLRPSPASFTHKAQCSSIPRHVSELELEVLFSCLSRKGVEVLEEIDSLNKTLQDILGLICVITMHLNSCMGVSDSTL